MDDSSVDMTSVCHTVDPTKKELLLMQDKYEAIIQENYELKRKLAVMEENNLHLESELMYLHKTNNEEKTSKVNLQQELLAASLRINKLESSLEEEKMNLQRVIREKNENVVKQHKMEFPAGHQEEIDNLAKQIQNLEVHQEEKENSIKILVDEKAVADHKIHQLQYDNKSLEDELKEIKKHLEQKTKDLQHLNEALESAREEKLLLSTEVQMLKAADNTASRGNSLFAEVEENRQKMAAQRELLKLKYLNLKKLFHQKQVESNKLKVEIIKLRKKEEEDDKNVHKDYNDLIQTYKERVAELETQQKNLEKSSSQPPLVFADKDSGSLDWVNNIVENARKETKTLRDELERRGWNYVVQGHKLFDSQKENRKLKLASAKLQAEIDELVMKLDILTPGNENLDGISPPAIEIITENTKTKFVKFNETVVEHSNNTSLAADTDSDKENKI